MKNYRATSAESLAVLETLVIDRKSGSPQYAQLYDQLRALILERVLQAGSKLPATRSLAADLRISRNTIVQVYEQLETEGYIETSHGKLAQVCNLPSVFSQPRSAELLPFSINASRRARKLIDIVHPSGHPEGFRFQPGMPDIEEFPFSTWRRLMNTFVKPGKRDLFGYYSYSGYEPLRQEISNYVQTSRGVKCTPEQVLITSGAQTAMNFLATVLTDPGDISVVEEPGYTGIQGALLAASNNLHPLYVDETGWQIEGLNGIHPKLIYLTPSCQFPVGVTMGAEQRLQLLEFARISDAWIIEDDFDSEYRFCSQPIPSMQGQDQNNRTLYVGTFSKTLFPSLRLGFIVFPGEVDEALAKASFLLGNTPPLILQATLAEFIKQGHFAKHLRRMKRIYDRRRVMFMKLAKPALSEWLYPVDSRTGLQIVWRFHDEVDDEAVSKNCQKQALNVTPLSVHYKHGKRASGLILGYALMSEREMVNSLNLLAAVLSDSSAYGVI